MSMPAVLVMPDMVSVTTDCAIAIWDLFVAVSTFRSWYPVAAICFLYGCRFLALVSIALFRPILQPFELILGSFLGASNSRIKFQEWLVSLSLHFESLPTCLVLLVVSYILLSQYPGTRISSYLTLFFKTAKPYNYTLALWTGNTRLDHPVPQILFNRNVELNFWETCGISILFAYDSNCTRKQSILPMGPFCTGRSSAM
jgi:hypothetical protein